MRNFQQLGCLAAVADPSSEARAEIGRLYPGVPAFHGLGPMLEACRIDAVVIATPAASHGMLVGQALSSGLDVLVEKPLCLDVQEAERLKLQARSSNRVLMVGHLLLYHPAFRSLKAAMEQDALGRLRYIYSNRLSLGTLRREENALWSFAPHDVSMILSLVGAMPESVRTTGGSYLSNGVADTTLSVMNFRDGVQAHIFVSWLHPYKEHKLVVVGERAMAVFHDSVDGPEKLTIYRHDVGWRGAIPVVNKAVGEPIPYPVGEPLRIECEAFVEALSTRHPPPSNAEEAIGVLRVLDACQQALTSGLSVNL